MANPPAPSILTASNRRLLREIRTATLATLDPHGRPRLVPCCYDVHPELAWLRLCGQALLLEPDEAPAAPERLVAISALRERYPQYRAHDLESRPIIAVEITEAVRWATRES